MFSEWWYKTNIRRLISLLKILCDCVISALICWGIYSATVTHCKKNTLRLKKISTGFERRESVLFVSKFIVCETLLFTVLIFLLQIQI